MDQDNTFQGIINRAWLTRGPLTDETLKYDFGGEGTFIENQPNQCSLMCGWYGGLFQKLNGTANPYPF